MTFLHRTDAGRQLADSLRLARRVHPIVIGITRGGVPVAAEIARQLVAPLDICVVRKLVAPGDAPVTFGAVAEGDVRCLEEDEVVKLGLTAAEVDEIAAHERAEVARLARLFRDRPPLDVRNREVILVDDGMITGSTVRAAVGALRGREPRAITLALPVASSEALASVRAEVDAAVCLELDRYLVAVGARYADFFPVAEAEIVDQLAASHREHAAALNVAAMI